MERAREVLWHTQQQQQPLVPLLILVGVRIATDPADRREWELVHQVSRLLVTQLSLSLVRLTSSKRMNDSALELAFS
jgi:hypothetical protein